MEDKIYRIFGEVVEQTTDIDQIEYSLVEQSLELRLESLKESDDVMRISGIASFFGKPDMYNTVITKESMNLVEYKKNPIISIDHRAWESSGIIGRATKLKKTEEGLEVEAELLRESPVPDIAHVLRFIEKGLIKSFSIGAFVKWKERNVGMDYVESKETRLFDISVVSMPGGVVKGGYPGFKVKRPGAHYDERNKDKEIYDMLITKLKV